MQNAGLSMLDWCSSCIDDDYSVPFKLDTWRHPVLRIEPHISLDGQQALLTHDWRLTMCVNFIDNSVPACSLRSTSPGYWPEHGICKYLAPR